jgi:hypothetical protein
MKHIFFVCLLASTACGKSHKAAEVPIDAAPINAAAHALADRVCGCNNDHACVKYARADWDVQKKIWLPARTKFAPGPAAVFDSETGRMSMCGDAAGLTFWREL